MNERLMQRTLAMATANVRSGNGGPFAALVVKDGRIIGEGTSLVASTNDPTAHAEIVAIRATCAHLGSFQLPECDIYTTCEPCPMCLGAIYWARAARVFYAATRQDAADAGFDDALIYQEIALAPADRRIAMHQLSSDSRTVPFDAWRDFAARVEY